MFPLISDYIFLYTFIRAYTFMYSQTAGTDVLRKSEEERKITEEINRQRESTLLQLLQSDGE